MCCLIYMIGGTEAMESFLSAWAPIAMMIGSLLMIVREIIETIDEKKKAEHAEAEKKYAEVREKWKEVS